MATAQNQQSTRRIWYVGLKGDHPQGETAFFHLTGIVWRTGDVHEIPTGIASQMLAHPDVFSDKSPEERAKLAEEAKQRALEEQAAQQQAGAGAGLAAIFAALPAGTTIKLPDGREVIVSAAPAGSAPAAAGAARGLEGASERPMAARLAAATGAQNENGEPTTSLTGQVGDATGGTERVQETQVGGSTDAAGINLAPGAVVNPAAANTGQGSAPAPTTAPVPTPAPTSAPAPAASKAKRG